MRPAHTAASRGGETRAPEEPGGTGDEGVIDETGEDRGARGRLLAGLRFTSLRLRLVLVFGLVALTAAVSASGIAYWLNREAVLTRTQDAALSDFHQELQSHAAALPPHPRRPNCGTRPPGWRTPVSITRWSCWTRTRTGTGSRATPTSTPSPWPTCRARCATRSARSRRGPRATRRRTTCSGSGRWRTGRRT
ncbi:hypothetical protein ACFQVA_13905 [Actinomadura keratinilytica]